MLYPIKVSQLLEAADGRLVQGSPDDLIYSFATDTRKLKQGDFFIAVKGDYHNGHDFVSNAVSAGAKGVIISEIMDLPENKSVIIKVNNTLNAYLAAAGIYLKNFKTKTIGITGSVGKTTTKEITADILSKKYKVLKSEGSFNNEIGIPQTIFKLDDSIEILVLELAMRGKNQIRELCKIVNPKVGIITSIGESHYEFMNSYEAIAEAKAELLLGLGEDGLAVINNDDKFSQFLKTKTRAPVTTFGVKNDADVTAKNIIDMGLEGARFDVNIRGKGAYNFKTSLLSLVNVSNILSAVAAAVYMNVGLTDIQEAVYNLKPAPHRLQKKILPQGAALIDDCYNASPKSARAALEFIGGLSVKGRKIAVLSDMLELGKIEESSHFNLGYLVAKNSFDFLVVLGNNADKIKQGAVDSGFKTDNIFMAENNISAAEKLGKIIREGDVILLKGSRKTKLEEIGEEVLKMTKSKIQNPNETEKDK